ncbi:hypothetical protein AB205_0182080, partial [Aquarana catesbeiana]
MMQLFGWDDMVTPQLVSRYLSHLIANRTLTEALKGIGNAAYQALSIRTWSRCVLQMYVDQPVSGTIRTDTEQALILSEQLTELTRLIFKLPEIENLFVKAQIEPASYKQDPKSALLQFFQIVGIVYSGLETLSEKSAMGLSIISRQSQVQASYVKQQLKTIIEQYFGRFLPSAPQAPTAGSHPILLALCDSVQSPHTAILRKTVMQVINENHLQFKGQAPPPRLASVLSFIVDVFQRSKTIEVADAEFLLPAILKCMI